MLVGAIIVFLLLLVPYFQNIAYGIRLYFFGKEIAYHTGFRLFVVWGMILWSLTTFAVQGFIEDVKKSTNKNKFDM